MDPFEVLKEIEQATGGKIEEIGILPDNSGFATMSMPLKPSHWIYTKDPVYDAPPMPFRTGDGDQVSVLIQRHSNATPFEMDPPIRMTRKDFADKVREAGKYAVRSATMNGEEMDFDPDALLQNLVVGMLGYWTDDGLDHEDDWANPPQYRKGKENG